MAKHKIPQEIRSQIIARFNDGDNMATISKDLKVPYYSVRNTVNAARRRAKEEQYPACPSCFKDFNEAAMTAIACKNIGFDSDYTGILCRTKGCSVQSLVDIANWFSKNASIQINSTMKGLRDQISERDEQLRLYKQRLDESRKKNQESNEALAKFAKQVLLLEKSESELLAEKTLLKKVLAGFSQKL